MSPLFSSTLPKFPREMGGCVAVLHSGQGSDAPPVADLAFFRSDFFSRVDFLSLSTIPAPVRPSAAHHNILWLSKMSDNIYYVNFLGFSERFLSDFGELLSPQVPTTISCVSTTEASDPPLPPLSQCTRVHRADPGTERTDGGGRSTRGGTPGNGRMVRFLICELCLLSCV
jgi:hypothetical protein